MNDNTGILITYTRLWLTDPRGLDKGRGPKFRVGFRVQQAPEENRRTNQPKRCKYNSKDEDKSPKTLNDKNIQRT